VIVGREPDPRRARQRPALLGDVAGGFDLGRMVNGGNSNVQAGGTAGAAIGGGLGWVGGAASDAWSQLGAAEPERTPRAP